MPWSIWRAPGRGIRSQEEGKREQSPPKPAAFPQPSPAFPTPPPLPPALNERSLDDLTGDGIRFGAFVDGEVRERDLDAVFVKCLLDLFAHLVAHRAEILPSIALRAWLAAVQRSPSWLLAASELPRRPTANRILRTSSIGYA